MKLALLLLLAGCAELPLCPPAEAVIFQATDGGFYVGFDAENLAKWMDATSKRALGQCAFPKKGGV